MIAVAVAVALALITCALTLADDGATSLWRHAYHVPVIAAALYYGAPGILATLAAILLYAPFVIPALERSGPSEPVLEGLVTFAMLLGSGVLSAALAIGVRRQRRRFETLVAVQRSLEGEVPLAVALTRLRACLTARLDAEVGLAVHDGAGLTVAGGVEVTPGSAVARVLDSGVPLFVADAGGVMRPRRCFVTPIGRADHRRAGHRAGLRHRPGRAAGFADTGRSSGPGARERASGRAPAPVR
jgi:hypothetical protein